jgi:hypothetical protein
LAPRRANSGHHPARAVLALSVAIHFQQETIMPSDITGDPTAYPAGIARTNALLPVGGTESAFSGVSWGAIIAGGIGAAAMAAILMTLGTGLGLIAVSPWPGQGATAETIGIGVIIWSIVVEVAAFGLGGYLAGRLRTKWANLHGDEVYFRDTAHGFVTWALGSLVSVAIMTSVAGHLVRGTAEVGTAGAAAAGGAGLLAMSQSQQASQGGPAQGQAGAGQGMRGNPMDYYIDMLFRPASGQAPGAATGSATGATSTAATTTATGTAATPAPGAIGQPMPGNAPGNDGGPARAEINRIVAKSFVNGEITLSAPDKSYVAQLISQRTGMSQQDAEKRVDDVVTQAKNALDEAKTKAQQAADDARKVGAGLALWSFISMLIGAFVASYAATIGGRHRDL